MYYVLLENGRTIENIPEFHPALPGVPIIKRYTKEVLDMCITSTVEIPQGWLYSFETGKFSEPPKSEEEIEDDATPGW